VPPAGVSAILDALRPFGIDHIDIAGDAESRLAGDPQARSGKAAAE
jgi:hypothetical protein